MIQKFKNFLESHEFEILPNENAFSIRFRSSSGFFCEFLYDEDDPLFFQIIVPYLVNIEEKTKTATLEAAIKTNTEVKVVKVVVVDDYLWLSLQQFIPFSSPSVQTALDCDVFFNRLLSLIDFTVGKLKDNLQNVDTNG